jgi:hypothetical protein
MALSGAAVWFFYPRATPLYCLLVLGPQGKTRVWVVWRDETAYLHRDGDLTSRGEPMVCESGDWASVNMPGKWWRFSSLLTAAEDGSAYSIEFVRGSATETPDADRRFAVYARVGGTFTLVDADPSLELAVNPEAAPVIPFGRLQIVPENPDYKRQRLILGGETDLRAWIGTFPAQKGATGISLVHHHAGGVPENAHPVAVIQFANAKPGGPPISLRCVLDRRC